MTNWKIVSPFGDAETQRKLAWVADMLGAAEPSADTLGISPAANLAQAALETGWGAHIVGKHNLFGIKATPDWTGTRVLVRTREVLNGQSVMIDDWFRDYPDFAGSIADHLAFLNQNSRYRAAGVFERMGDELFFRALQNGHYATDPEYALHLIAVRDTVTGFFMPHLGSDADANRLAPTVAVVAPSAHRCLMVAMHGDDVLDLQRRLGFSAASDLDGWFGNATRGRVIAFQSAHKLTADGVVGDKTWAALGVAPDAA